MQLPQHVWSDVLTAEKTSLKHLYNLEMTISSSLGMVYIYNYLPTICAAAATCESLGAPMQGVNQHIN